ncbi:MAG: DUF374 domain-containing protein [Planctomycetaceae bacterium]|nr:DUF374 domain-containing protein [Planctomycetaceae bacterium]
MKVRNRFLNIALSYVATFLLRLLFLTVRVDHRAVDPDATPYIRPPGKTRFTFCLWHDVIAVAVFARRTWNLSGLISRHTDGSYLADSCRIAGIHPVRGSASRGGAEAVAELLELTHLHVAMTPDGPRGPRRKLKEGIIFIGSRSRRPVVPTAIAGTNAWSVKGSWTDLLIPKPFSTVYLFAGKPINIPHDLDRSEFGTYTEMLQLEMERMDSIAKRVIAGDMAAADELPDRPLFPHETAEWSGPFQNAA